MKIYNLRNKGDTTTSGEYAVQRGRITQADLDAAHRQQQQKRSVISRLFGSGSSGGGIVKKSKVKKVGSFLERASGNALNLLGSSGGNFSAFGIGGKKSGGGFNPNFSAFGSFGGGRDKPRRIITTKKIVELD